jgi:two-component system chemotaxis sensor kinase CheA
MKIDKSKYIGRFCDEAGEHLKKISDGLVILEKNQADDETMNQLFRSAHTVKGSGRMLGLTKISDVAHKLEDVLEAVKKGELTLTQAHFNALLAAVDVISEAVAGVRQTQSDAGFEHEAVVKALAAVLKAEGAPKDIASPNQAESEYTGWFCDEASEHLKKISDGLVLLEKNQDNTETLDLIFRSAHTIKGSARMLGLSKISDVVHKLEDILDAVKEKKLKLTQAHFGRILVAVDRISTEVLKVRQAHNDTGFDHEPVVKALFGILQGEELPKDATVTRLGESAESAQPSASLATAKPEPFPPPAPVSKETAVKVDETLRISASKLDETIKILGEVISSQSRIREHGNTLESILKSLQRAIKALPENVGENHQGQSAYEETTTAISNSIGALKQLGADYKNDVAYQSILTDQLMERGSRLRMLPLSTTLDTFYRYTRDIAVSCGKSIELRITGGETELDKKIIENIGDPLMHMIRNCIDHGIESTEQRKNAGKPETGTITIAAGYEGVSVFIHISDDGGGIPLEKVRQKAIDKRIYTREALSQLPESEIINLIFKPGFSTSGFITDISGRGVGMDVVRQNVVEKLKGAIFVTTEAGKGTDFHITLPLTLAMMRVFLISLGDTVFGIMVSSIEEVMKIRKTDVIAVVDKKAIRLREQLVPLVELSALVGLPGRNTGLSDDLNVVVLISSGEKMAVVVDSMINEEDMEIKPLPYHLRRAALVSGVALTGKSEIALVLNTTRLFAASKNLKEADGSTVAVNTGAREITILVVDDSVNTREIERSILESYGYKVNVAADGMEAYEKAQSFNYDLIVTDVEMPVMDGFSLTEKLRKDSNYKHTPIIIVSSRDRDEDKRKGAQAGANAYIVKGSFDQSNLLDTVQALLDTSTSVYRG